MNVDSIRQFCLKFPEATEKLQWGETLCFKVDGKLFATMSLDAVPPSLCVKCTPERFAELTEMENIVPAPYVGRYKWILMQRLDVLSGEETKALIRQSYEMVTAKKRGHGKKRKTSKMNKRVRSARSSESRSHDS